jgi:pilus assembly protein Flp/PilA
MSWKAKIKKIWLDQSGATAIEYGLIVSLIVISMMVGLQAVAGTTIDMWNDVSERVQEVIGS